VTRRGAFLTDSMLEAHRINSPYLLEGAVSVLRANPRIFRI
jgi:hypothetical protein